MEGTFNKFSEATVEEMLNDPHKFGAPTFDEYVRNRSHYKQRLKDHDWFSEIDKSSSILKNGRLKKQYYILNGHRFNTLEALEKACESEGVNPLQLVPEPQVIDLGGGWCDLEVTMLTPTQQAMKKGVTKSGIILV